MSRSRLSSGVLVSAVVAGVLVAVPAISASAAPTDCPTAFPTAEAVDGVTGTGYTVERGTTADPFTATVLGRITDGIAPGVDMIMANLESPALTRAGGVWAGMSGSPVYAADGRLIGSVSYGLASSSPIAGITPAADMQKLLTTTGGTTPQIAKIKVSAALAKKIAKTGVVTAAQADDGFKQLPVPVSVSGTAKKSAKFLNDLTSTAGVRVHTGGSRITATASSPSEITAGSNFAAALSYGDVSIAGVGTTTFVCNGQAIAFGHPLINAGNVEYTAHPATAVYVQPDPVYGPFKVSNPGGPVGVVDRDRTTGIRAELGAQPTGAFAVTTSLTPNGGTAVTGSTTGIYQPWAADIAALHLQSNIVKALGSEGAGSAALKFVISGTKSDGTPFTLTRSDHYSDTSDLSYAAADDLYGLVSSLSEQSFDDLKITSVNVTGSVSDSFTQYRVTSVKLKSGTAWVKLPALKTVSAGKTIQLQITLTKYRSTKTTVVLMAVRAPAGSQGASGDLYITDGPSADGGDSSSDPTTLAELLAQLSKQPTNDSVAGSLSLSTDTGTASTLVLKRVDAPVASYLKDLAVQVKP
jgi:hypothetical protein